MKLKRDYIGPYSGIVYGNTNDDVLFIGKRGEMVLVEFNGERFHVWPQDLDDNGTEVKIENKEPDIKVEKPITFLPKEESKPPAAVPELFSLEPPKPFKKRKK